MTLADCKEGSLVRMWSGEEVRVELINKTRARIRSTGHEVSTFVDNKGKEHTVKARRPARDVAPTTDIIEVLEEPKSEGVPE